MSASRTGKKHSPETIAKLTEIRRARELLTDEQKAAAKAKKEELAWRKWDEIRRKRWRADQRTAFRLGNKELFDDVTQSWGWRFRRTILDYPGVSNGYCKKSGRILWPHKKIDPKHRSNISGIA